MKIDNVKLLNKFLIIFYEGGEFNKTLKHGTLELEVNPDWDRTNRVKDYATVYKAGAKSVIPEGAKVWADYKIASQEQEPLHVDEKGSYFMCKEEQVFLYQTEDGIRTIGEYVILEAEEQDKENTSAAGIITPNERHEDEEFGTVLYSGDAVKEVKVGQRLMVNPKVNYKFRFQEQDLYRIHSRLGVVAIMV